MLEPFFYSNKIGVFQTKIILVSGETSRKQWRVVLAGGVAGGRVEVGVLRFQKLKFRGVRFSEKNFG
jgi:hypothetical protein